jgi:predicted membrane-bound spermidine synthase
MLGSVLRPVGSYVSRAITGAQPSEQLVAIEQAVEVLGPVNVARAALLYTTNNDIADSWPVVIDHVRDNGVLYGETFLGIPARFMPTRMRVNAGLLTAGDLLNIRYYGSAYAEKSFGFNVTLANELVLNFGPAGLVFGLVVGGLMAMADLWLTRVRAVSALAVLMAFALFGVGFTAEPAANVQWLAGMIVVGLLVEAGSRVSVRAPFGSGATLRSMPQTVHVR